MDSKIKVKIDNVYKIFGNNPDKARKLLNQGVDKEEIFKKTKQAVGVADASFEVREGETLVIMGLSGSGKSTLLRCVNRLIEPSFGKIYIDDEDITTLSEKELIALRREKFGMVFQRFALLPHRRVIENVDFGLEIQGMKRQQRREKAMEALKLVGLDGWENSYPHQLSGGMQQRVGLARALAVDPDILLMDEAFSALDPLIRTDMQDELLSLESQVKKTIIFITHDLDEALKLGDRIVLMKDGKIVQIGTSEEILTNPADEYVRRFLENIDLTKVLSAEDVMQKPRAVTFLKDGPQTALHIMKTKGMSGIFVVRQNFELAGWVTVESAVKAQKEKDITLEKVMEINPDFWAPIHTPVRDLFALSVRSDFPMPVVDEKKRLKGIIVKGAILAGLAERGELND